MLNQKILNSGSLKNYERLNSRNIQMNNVLLNKIREKFHHIDKCPYQGTRVFFENAGGSLTLKSVVKCSAEMAAIPDNQGRDNPASIEMSKIMMRGKKDIYDFLGTIDGTVFIGETGTELLFRMISVASLGAEMGGNIVGSTLEHPSSVSACKRWSGVTDRDFIQVPHNSTTGTVTVEDYRSYVTKDTRIATIIHTSPVTGIAVNVDEIVHFIRSVSPHCYIIVDGIQHVAHGCVDLSALEIDGYAISPYKVFSRHGYGIGWVSERMNSLPHDKLIGNPNNSWELGTRDVAATATFSEVVNYFNWLGEEICASGDKRKNIIAAGEFIKSQENDLVQAVLFGLDGHSGLNELASINIIAGIANPNREGVVSFYVEGQSSEAIVQKLSSKGIRVHARKNDNYSGAILEPLNLESCIRVSLAHYNSLEEVAKFLEAMTEII